MTNLPFFRGSRPPRALWVRWRLADRRALDRRVSAVIWFSSAAGMRTSQSSSRSSSLLMSLVPGKPQTE